MDSTNRPRNSLATAQTPRANGNPPQTSNARLASTEILDRLVEDILEMDGAGAILLTESLDVVAIQDLAIYRVNGDDDDPDGDVSLLQLASAYSVSSELVSLIALKCPNLLLVQRTFPCEGQTPLHTLISKENVRAVASILVQQTPEMKGRLLKMSTNTIMPTPINATVMLGGLPLSVAALTFNIDLVDLLLEHGTEMNNTNDRGDTVFHSLVRFSTLYPEKEDRVVQMMADLHRRLKERHEPRSVWLTENHQGLTALKLAARGSQPLLFNFILMLKGVYCDLDEHDGLFDSLLYDITDIDPIAIKRLEDERKSTGLTKYNKVHAATAAVQGISDNYRKEAKRDTKIFRSSFRGGSASLRRMSSWGGAPGGVEPETEVDVSVLEIIYETENSHDAFKILGNQVVSRVIQEKWSRYSWLFVLWTVLHLLTMIWITIYAVCKTRVTADQDHAYRLAGAAPLATSFTATTVVPIAAPVSTRPTTTQKETALPLQLHEDVGHPERQFVFATALLTGLWAVCLVIYECTRMYRSKSVKGYFTNLLFYHNGAYRVQLIIFGLCILIDDILLALWYERTVAANNYCLLLALLVGWWFSTFFLRPWKKFSFFTVMLQEVLVGDMFRFSIIFIPELIAFSIAMHITFLPMEGPLPEEFATMGTTLMTMFKLMLGLSDVSVLYQAPKTWLAILLFVLYVLLTYTLMLNALIALMSNTCSIVSENRDNQWKLQRLSIVLFLQDALWMCTCLHSTGQARRIRIEDIDKKQTTAKTRFVLKISSVRSGEVLVKHLGGAGKADDADDDDEESSTAAATDMYDLLASLNFQRKQARAIPDLQDTARQPTRGGSSDLQARAGGRDGASVSLQMSQQLSSTYVGIRQKLKKLSKDPFCGDAEKRASCAAPVSMSTPPVAAAAVANTTQQNPPAASQEDVVDGKLENETEQEVPASPVMSETLRPAKGERVIMFPTMPDLNLEALRGSGGPAKGGEGRRPKGQRPMSVEKRQKLRSRPTVAERRERFHQKHRDDFLAKRMTTPEVKNSSPAGSISSMVGHGIYEVNTSRIHMHTSFQS